MTVSDIELRAPDGTHTCLQTLLGDGLTVIQIVRYYGCLPCKEYISQLAQRYDEFARLNTAVVVVGGSADYQQKHLAKQGYPFQIMLDPDHKVRRAAEFTDLTMLQLLDPRGAGKYLKAIAAGAKQGKITKDTVKSPGVLILNTSGEIVWAQEGKYLGAYPSVDEVLAALESL